jgi:hypothetical protein
VRSESCDGGHGRCESRRAAAAASNGRRRQDRRMCKPTTGGLNVHSRVLVVYLTAEGASRRFYSDRVLEFKARLDVFALLRGRYQLALRQRPVTSTDVPRA